MSPSCPNEDVGLNFIQKFSNRTFYDVTARHCILIWCSCYGKRHDCVSQRHHERVEQQTSLRFLILRKINDRLSYSKKHIFVVVVGINRNLLSLLQNKSGLKAPSAVIVSTIRVLFHFILTGTMIYHYK